MLDWLNQFDASLFLFLNSLHAGWLDPVMIFFSGKLTWIPFYLVLLYLIIRQYRWQSLIILLFVAVLISLSDQLSVRAFKFIFERPRPCHEPDLQPLIYLASGRCGGAFGFVSSHAANSFAMAGFVWFLLRNAHPIMGWILFPWAAIVSYSRIYLGVHYPGDILAGAVLGLTVSWVVWQIYRRSCGAGRAC
ncbi:MAG: phosphatase PAP2 family protein [Bacteroidales bacterium]|jgi:undecaprenyl-diphosphatase|nr:phosphatase PAP2 family protein [Bacteroidales bacterium]HOI32904.1 phosphatase PAP2 family protein [Bacteroidales bacterium]